jgi:hypothetical protein
MEQDNTLPRDGQAILALAARSMFQLFSSVSQGMFRAAASSGSMRATSAFCPTWAFPRWTSLWATWSRT